MFSEQVPDCFFGMGRVEADDGQFGFFPAGIQLTWPIHGYAREGDFNKEV